MVYLSTILKLVFSHIQNEKTNSNRRSLAWHGMAWHGVLCICSKLQLTALISNAYILNEYREK